MWPTIDRVNMHTLDHSPVTTLRPYSPSSPYGFNGWPTNHQRYMDPRLMRDFLPPGQPPQLPGPHYSVHQYPDAYPGFTLPQSNYTSWHHHPMSTTRRQMPVSPLHNQFHAPLPTPSNSALGPPLKPKRSGHALWVGNLHPSTTITQLKDHFSRSATADIESVFLISRSTCAFVNYKSEEACRSAHARFHSTRLNGNALVCRPRRDSEPNTRMASSASPGSSSSESQKSDSSKRTSSDSPTTPVIVGAPKEIPSTSEVAPKPTSTKIPERFFIVKSSTLQDLDTSVRNSSWVTQLHNEQSLKSAFEGAEIVYLIFSANKSREYFGVARMSSIPSERPHRTDGQAQAHAYGSKPGSPQFIPTLATATAPPGRIVDDSGRGTVFWEVTGSEESDVAKQESVDDDVGDRMGTPFSVEWLCLTRVPFIRTRGLRNPWNSNREIKVARDGTEIEPRAGRKLLSLFTNASNIGNDMAGTYM